MECHSTSCSSSSFMEYDVFLSFRGEDTRNGFTSHLYEALQAKGLHVFMDERDLETGKRIAPGLWKAVKLSAICIAILSNGYADSKWCLMELANMVNCKKTIIPVFYHVDPSDVRKQQGPFRDAFQRYEDCSNLPRDHSDHVKEQKKRKWRAALNHVGNLKGYDLDGQYNGNEQQLKQTIVKRVLNELNDISVEVAKYPVGIDTRVDKIMKLLSLKSVDVRMVGIYGMGGIGKTTLAKAVFNKIYKEFDASCFVKDIRIESQTDKGLVSLQKQLLSQLLNVENLSINNADQGSALMRRRLRCKHVLVILDDVDSIRQVDALAGGHDWFDSGSRIIITTRDLHVLNTNMITGSYNVDELDAEESLELLSWHAFGRKEPIEEFREVSIKIAEATSGLPLAIESVGSELFDKTSIELWVEMFEKLQRIPHRDVQRILRISYGGLDPEEQAIFLDIACFFIGEKKEYVTDILKGCRFAVLLAIEVFIHRSLVKIDADELVQMHDQVRDMGRNIVKEEDHLDPGKRSRIHDTEEAFDVIDRYKGTDRVQGILLNGDSRRDFTRNTNKALTTKAFGNMSNMRLLLMNTVNIRGDFSRMPKTIRSMEWQFCPLTSLPDDFDLEKIGFLNLAHSQIRRVWKESRHLRNKVFLNLRVLNLRKCMQLTRFPDFSCVPNLEKLILEWCMNLVSVPESIGRLKKLVHLDMGFCCSFKKLPDSIGRVKTLTRLILLFTSIEDLPHSIGSLDRLEVLQLTGSLIFDQLPDSIGNLTRLKELGLRHTSLRKLPESICNLKNLSILELPEVEYPLQWITSLQNLKILSVLGCRSSFACLTNLEELSMGLCDSLSPFHDFGNLKNLSNLNFSLKGMGEIPQCIVSLESLKKLSINAGYELTHLPDSIGNLTKLEELELSFCTSLTELPSSIGNMRNLFKLNLFKVGITSLPTSIASLDKLNELVIGECWKLRGPLPLWEMKGLKNLKLGVGEIEPEEDVEHFEGKHGFVELSAYLQETQEYRELHLLERPKERFASDEWELVVGAGNQEKVIRLSVKADNNSTEWLRFIYSGDYVVDYVRTEPMEANGLKAYVNKTVSVLQFAFHWCLGLACQRD